MDQKTKKMIGVVLILLGIAAVGVIGYDYLQNLATRNSPQWAGRYAPWLEWHWTSGEIFQIIAGFISMGAGVFMLRSRTENK